MSVWFRLAAQQEHGQLNPSPQQSSMHPHARICDLERDLGTLGVFSDGKLGGGVLIIGRHQQRSFPRGSLVTIGPSCRHAILMKR
jgi:hypothetical protein